MADVLSRRDIKLSDYFEPLQSRIQKENSFIPELVNLSNKSKEKFIENDENYFSTISDSHKPNILWIGCSDSRVDPSDIINTDYGNLYIQRNVANQVSIDNPNILSVIEFAVFNLKVSQIIVCGHTACGGVVASCGDMGSLDPHLQKYLTPLNNLYKEVSSNPDLKKEDVSKVMFSKNVQAQVENLLTIDAVKEAVERKELEIIPLMFELETGKLQSV